MINKFLLWTYRTEFKEVWVRKYQWWYLGVGFAIFIPLIVNRFGGYWFISESTILDTIYWTSLFLINLNTIYLTIDFKYGRKILKEYYNNLLRYDKVVCCWEDEILEKGKTYIIEDAIFQIPNFDKMLKGTPFIFSSVNYRICKLISLKEQRRMKLEKLGR